MTNADSKRAAGPSGVSLAENTQPTAEKPEAAASSVDDPAAASAAAATRAEPPVSVVPSGTEEVRPKEDGGLLRDTRSVIGGMGSRSTNTSSSGSNNSNSSCSNNTGSSCSGSTSSSCSISGAGIDSNRGGNTGREDFSSADVVTHAVGTDAGSKIRSTLVNSSSSLGATGSDKPINDFGIPTGVESMRALRRHVELLIDREGNSMARSRLETCLDALEPEKLDTQVLRVVCAKGLPEGCPALRSLYWRILLHCLPLRPTKWQQRRRQLREAYESYKAEFIREPEAVRRLRSMQQQQQHQHQPHQQHGRVGDAVQGANLLATMSGFSSDEAERAAKSPASFVSLGAVNDHPLCRSATSEWRGFWMDAEVFDQINKDVFRTRPELCFFALNPEQTVSRQQQLHLYPPPPTRQQQHFQEEADEVPLLVNYDALQQQKEQQRRKVQAAGRETARITTKSSSSKSSSDCSHDHESSSKVSSSPLRGFRLSAAFRLRKSLPAVSRLNEAGCGGGVNSNSSSRSSGRGTSYTSDTGSQVRSNRDDDDVWNKGKKAGGAFNKSFSLWIDELQRRGAGGRSSGQAADAADALEASAAAAKAARLYKRQLSAGKRQGDCNKTVRGSFPDLRVLSQDAVDDETAFPLRVPAGDGTVSAGLPREASPARVALKGSPLAGSASADTSTSLEASADGVPPFVGPEAASPAAVSQSCGGGVDEAKLALEARRPQQEQLQQEQLQGKQVQQEQLHREQLQQEHLQPEQQQQAQPRQGQVHGKQMQRGQPQQQQVQPWRAPAGVQDVCNMLSPRRHYDVLSRLLFIYAKVNPGLCYVQGMNEILAPIYYALMTDPTYTDYEQAEAEVFYCFSELMQQQRDAFCKALDPTDSGVRGRLSRLDALLRHKDEETWVHLNTVGVEPQFYALRWLLLLLTQEFEMPDVLALWDGFIADSGRPLPLLYYVCVAMIIWLKPALLAGDFTACMKLLQHLPSFDPKALISSAMRLRADDLLGSRLPVWRVSLPMAVGEGRLGEGLKELDPLQAAEYQQSKGQRSWATSGIISIGKSNSGCAEGFVLLPGKSSCQLSSPGAAAVRQEKESYRDAAEGIQVEAGSTRGSLDASEVGLGQLKRLAGVGVEQAYKGASVVSQYLNNSGLAMGLASNLSSFFSSDSLPGAVAPNDEQTLSPSPATQQKPSAALKLGRFFASSQAKWPGSAQGFSAPRERGATVDCASPVQERLFASAQSPKGSPSDSPLVAESATESPSQGLDGFRRAQRLLPLGEQPPAENTEKETDSPRSDESCAPFKTSPGDGLRISIL